MRNNFFFVSEVPLVCQDGSWDDCSSWQRQWALPRLWDQDVHEHDCRARVRKVHFQSESRQDIYPVLRGEMRGNADSDGRQTQTQRGTLCFWRWMIGNNVWYNACQFPLLCRVSNLTTNPRISTKPGEGGRTCAICSQFTSRSWARLKIFCLRRRVMMSHSSRASAGDFPYSCSIFTARDHLNMLGVRYLALMIWNIPRSPPHWSAINLATSRAALLTCTSSLHMNLHLSESQECTTYSQPQHNI